MIAIVRQTSTRIKLFRHFWRNKFAQVEALSDKILQSSRKRWSDTKRILKEQLKVKSALKMASCLKDIALMFRNLSVMKIKLKH